MARFELLEDGNSLADHELDYLREVELFKGLSDEEIIGVMSLSRKVAYPKGHVLMEEGEAGDSIYIIREGEVEVSKTLTLPLARGAEARTEKALTRCGTKERAVFGELSLFDESTRSAKVTCLTECSFYMIDRHEFLRFCDQNRDVGYILFRNLAKMVCERLRRASEDIVKLTTALTIALQRR